MDKNTNLKKKEVFMKENDNNSSICVKIEVIADHLLDSDLVDAIEKQLFNINLHINAY